MRTAWCDEIGWQIAQTALVVCWAVLMAGCGTSGAKTSTSGSAGTGTSGSAGAAAAVEANHVVLVVLENQNYADVVGSTNAPYLNSLIAQGTLATNYFADAHPSIPNYFMMTTGQTVTTDDEYTGTVSPPEIVSALTSAGMNWKVYAEGIPAAGYTGGDTGSYLKRHDPLAYFTDVEGTPAADNIIPFTQFATDIAGTLPSFTMVVGNIYDVGHNCQPTVTICTTGVELQQADSWLKTTIPQILANTSFASSGVLVVTFDESANDNTHGGGRVATVLLGTNVKAGYKAIGFYQHESLLRLMLQALGVTTLPNGSATAASMDEVWK